MQNEDEYQSKKIPVSKDPFIVNKMDDLPGANRILINNAGLVLLNNYFTMLFERLDLVHENKFLNPEAQDKAVHYLQFTASGLSHREEMFLPLNKLLCGLPPDHPVSAGIEMEQEQIQLIEGMINAAIEHWPATGTISVDGFRGNWLIREGILTEREDRWELAIEKNPYDLLLNQAPFSFSIINYPWMAKPLQVNWPY